ncbi:MAG: DUF6901 family protein [Pseudomonadota bacterium]
MSTIVYELKLEDRSERRYEVDIGRPDRMIELNAGDYPTWAELQNQQCDNCPLSPQQYRYCPAAVEFEEIAQHFANAASIERVDVWVHTPQRSYFKNCDMQTMLKSLYGLIMATSACPILNRLKPMAHFHLPFATLEETIHRMVGNYLVGEYLRMHDGTGEPDWELKGIETLYKELRIVNVALMKRLRQASGEDANINAIQTFVSITSIIGMGVDDIIEKVLSVLRKTE